MEPWFRWSWPIGIRPTYPNGFAALGVWFIAAIPLMLASLGPNLRLLCRRSYPEGALWLERADEAWTNGMAVESSDRAS